MSAVLIIHRDQRGKRSTHYGATLFHAELQTVRHAGSVTRQQWHATFQAFEHLSDRMFFIGKGERPR